MKTRVWDRHTRIVRGRLRFISGRNRRETFQRILGFRISAKMLPEPQKGLITWTHFALISGDCGKSTLSSCGDGIA
jgi:hypothetical protein